MAERSSNNKWLWLSPLLLLIVPFLFLLGWLRWTYREPKGAEEPSLRPPPIETASTTIDEPEVAEEPSLPPPPVDRGTTTTPEERSSSTKTGPAPVDVSDAAIAAFDPDTIAMLNSHKYWTRNGLVDGLYDAWVTKKQQGVDVEDVRKQIAWALQGMYMEEY